MFSESPYILTLKESNIDRYCSWCLKLSSIRCEICGIFVYCQESCREKDKYFHQDECFLYSKEKSIEIDLTLVRMIVRTIRRLELDNGFPKKDLIQNVDKTIERRSWSDLLSHRNDLLFSDRHRKIFFETKSIFDRYFPSYLIKFDLLELVGKLLINRFRVGIHQSLLDGRISIGWSIYLTVSIFNHCCQPDLLQCSFDKNIRLKLSDKTKQIPVDSKEFYRLTLSYRHQNDFRLRLFSPSSFVPKRKQRQEFLSFFFFVCHCRYCDDHQRIEFEENASQYQCSTCLNYLSIDKDEIFENQWILTCRSNKFCSSIGQIQQRIDFPLTNQLISCPIDKQIENLRFMEKHFDENSIELIQQREFLFDLLLNRWKRTNQSTDLLIDLGDKLIRIYDKYLNDSSIYPKQILLDLIEIHRNSDKKYKVKFLLEKLIDLWNEDYRDKFDQSLFDDLVKLRCD